MKILQINSVYGVGSTGKLTRALHRGLTERGIESSVLYGRGPTSCEPGVVRVCSDTYAKLNNAVSRITGIRYGNCFFSTRRIIGEIERFKPDIVHIQCINEHFVNIYRLISRLKAMGVNTVLTLHAEFMYTANCPHSFECEGWKTGCGNCPRLKSATKSLFFDRTHASSMRMQRAFSGFDNIRIVSVSPWLSERASESPILGDKPESVIPNGVDTGIFHPHIGSAQLNIPAIEGKKIVLHVTALFRDRKGDPKGGEYVIKLARMMRGDNVVFLVAGKYELSEPLPDNVIPLGLIEDQERLAEYYSLADLTLLTSRRETYSMVCAESLCCGTPVAGFYAGGPELIALPEYSRFTEHGDTDSLCGIVRGMLFAESPVQRELIAEKAAEEYSQEHMIESYLGLYKSML